MIYINVTKSAIARWRKCHMRRERVTSRFQDFSRRHSSRTIQKGNEQSKRQSTSSLLLICPLRVVQTNFEDVDKLAGNDWIQ